MGALEQIRQMRSQGMQDNEIIRELQSRGFPPKEIQDALNQAQIKQAVFDTGGGFSESSPQNSPIPPLQSPVTKEAQSSEGMQGMQPSIINPPEQGAEPLPLPQQPAGQPEQKLPSYYEPPSAPASSEQYYEPEESYEYSESGGGFDSGTITEIAEQVFMDKTSQMRKQLEEMQEFKTLFQARVENMNERLERIEEMINKMQISILEKVGSYGKGIENLKKEVEMVQDSFGKIINPLVEQKESKNVIANLKKIARERTKKKTAPRKIKKTAKANTARKS